MFFVKLWEFDPELKRSEFLTGYRAAEKLNEHHSCLPIHSRVRATVDAVDINGARPGPVPKGDSVTVWILDPMPA
jgi:hypothetical protein